MIEKRKVNTFKIASTIILFTISIFFILPTLIIYSISFTSESEIIHEGFKIIPKSIDFTAYEIIFKNPSTILNAYGVSLFVTMLGTILSLLVMSLFAYPISRRDFKLKRFFSVYLVVIIMFNGGLVPYYMTVTSVFKPLINTIWIQIIPILFIPWNALLLKSFFTSIPFEIIESSKIDGASEFRILWQIILPLSKPGLATVGTFVALIYWNDWWFPLLFIRKTELYNIQYLLYNLMANMQAIVDTMQSGNASLDIDYGELPTESIRMAMATLALTPMLFIFPMFQKHFVKGISLGSVKG